MKRQVAILLATIYLFGATDAGQLLKLPLLMTHYIRHQQQNPGTTLFSFYKMHYVDKQSYDADYAQDMQLPFKTIPHAFYRYTPSLMTQPSVLRTAFILEPIELAPANNEAVFASLLIRKIFQPPRV